MLARYYRSSVSHFQIKLKDANFWRTWRRHFSFLSLHTHLGHTSLLELNKAYQIRTRIWSSAMLSLYMSSPGTCRPTLGAYVSLGPQSAPAAVYVPIALPWLTARSSSCWMVCCTLPLGPSCSKRIALLLRISQLLWSNSAGVKLRRGVYNTAGRHL